MKMRPSTRPDAGGHIASNQEILPFLLSLILVGLAGNIFRFSLFFNIDFLFGSIFALLALQLFGLGRGVVAAALISTYTIILWNHPYACLILTAEVAVVGWLFPRRKIGLVLADTLYWLCLGMPLVYFFHHGVMAVSWENTSIIMIKSAVNGIANALLARLLFAGYTMLSRSHFLPLREIISALLGFFVLFPALICIAISSRADFASSDQRIRTTLLHERDEMSERLENWLNYRKAPIDDIEKILGVNFARDGLRLILLDRNGHIISTNDKEQKARTPLVRGQGRLYPQEEGIFQWIPTLAANTPTMERWERSYYRTEVSIGALSEWKLILEQPVAPFQKELYDTYTRKLTLLFLILLGALLCAELLSRLITRTHEKLLAITSDLPTRLSGDYPIVWPESAIAETRRLSENFRSMSAKLSEQFNAIRKLNLTLEERVEMRTRELSESRERYDLALLGSQDGIWDWNVLTGEVFFSVRCFEMLGYAANELAVTYATFENLVHPDDRESVRKQIHQHLEQRIPYRVEFRMRKKDGEYIWILARGQALWNEQGQAVRMAGSHTDISERKQLEKDLRESNLLLKKVFASMNEAIIIVETGTRRILDCNITTEKMFGYPRDQIIGATTACLHVSEEMFLRFGSEMLQSYEGKGIFETTFPVRRKDGTVFVSEHSVTPIHDDQGVIVGYVCVMRDISERKKAENLLLSALREKEVLLKEIHHRVKNNLQIVYSLLALQANGIADHDVRSLFDESRNRIGSMALIHEKLYRSNDLSHVDFSHYLQELTQNIAGTYLRPEIKVIVAAEPIFLDINSGIPCGLIVNELVSNSFKYAFPAGKTGQITVKMTCTEEGRYLLSVADDGIGFPENIDFCKTTSLGLQLVTVLAGQLQGEISLSTAAGTRFSISFPGPTS